ncbi:hypothetical protein evm_012592 [Chilo suppressalis]|nr:hypothetical protein evm_012592 [Chilo suppressalis]
MFSRFLSYSKEKILLSFITSLIVVSGFYLYLNHLQEKRSVQSSGHRCVSELTSLKYQLNEVTEYKNRIDKLLTETQAAQERDQIKYKEIMENCVAMKQQATLCQNQFQDLQSECIKVRDEYNQLKKGLNI